MEIYIKNNADDITYVSELISPAFLQNARRGDNLRPHLNNQSNISRPQKITIIAANDRYGP